MHIDPILCFGVDLPRLLLVVTLLLTWRCSLHIRFHRPPVHYQPMINAFFIYNAVGDVLMLKVYKDSVKRNVLDIFRLQVINPSNRSTTRDSPLPVLTLGSTSFLFIRSNRLWFVAVTRSNQDALMVMEFLQSLVALLELLFASNATRALAEEDIIGNFSSIYEVLDEVADFGFPTNTEAVHVASVVPGLRVGAPRSRSAGSELNGAPKLADRGGSDFSDDSSVSPWRERGIKYRRNEIHLNVDEKVHALIDARGQVLRLYIDGSITMKSRLSGMPTCRFGLADERDNALGSVSLDDFKFHQCVDLAKYDSDHVIRFVPPDGTFELMSYHFARRSSLPFSLVPRTTELPHKLALVLHLRSNFPPKTVASDVVIRIPVFKEVGNVSVSSTAGKARFDPETSVVMWTLAKVNGDTEVLISVEMPYATSFTGWARPSINMDFTLDTFSASHLAVRYLKVAEKSNYRTVKWVRYATRAGSYEVRF